MRISWRRASLFLPGLILACSVQSRSSESSSNDSSSSGGCGGGGGGSLGSSVKNAPPDDGKGGGFPSEPAPTGQKWKPVETEACGRHGITWVLVDEVCGDGEGNDDPDSLHAPMFRDGAVVDNHLFAVDATHLWTFDLARPSATSRSSLLTGLGTPLAVDRRGTELVLAAGVTGLVLVDASNASTPTRSRSLELAGKAFDVQVAGDRAFVALGAAGIAEVDLAPATPAVTHVWPIGGFSAGIAARGSYAYVAACSTFKVVDLANGQVVAQSWVPTPIVDDRLVAPAKKVTLVGDVAFVAAGRYGAVAIDIHDPLHPDVLGNCTIKDDPAFYASGVRASNDRLYVAGGEWGILPIGVANAAAACSSMMLQAPPPKPDDDCSSKPPWEVVPWETIWAPPPPSKDPVQTLPVGDRVYAFGDARRIGVRAVDVRSTLDPALPLVNRFDEPRALLGIAATATRAVAAGPRGGVFTIAPNGALTRAPATTADAALQASSAVTLLDDGRWAALGAAGILVEGRAAPIAIPGASAMTRSTGAKVAVTSPLGVHLVDADSGAREDFALLHSAHLPLGIAADANGVYYAAPEWPAAARIAAKISSDLGAHTVFDAEDIMDASLWRKRLPRRHLVASARGLVEIAGVGPAVGLVVHGSSGTIAKVALPAFTYAGAATDDDHVYLTAIDRNLYKSYVVSVDIASTTPRVLSVEAFTGAASGIAVAADRVFIADADGAIRTYAIASNGVATFVSSTAVTQ
jgi:hypothetical protein